MEPTGTQWLLAVAAMLGSAFVAFFAIAGHASAQAAGGRLDPTFGRKGLAITAFATAGEEAAVQVGSAPNGSAVVGNALEGVLVRFLPDGSRDAHFGTGGKLVLGPDTAAEGIESFSFSPRAIAIDGAGRVVVFGAELDSSHTFNPGGFNGEVAASSAVVLRFNRHGRPDLTFGEGKGFMRSDFGLDSGLRTDIPMVAALAGRVDSRGRPVFVAGVTSSTSGCYAKPGVGYRPRAVVRLTESGRPDPTFGGTSGISFLQGTTSFPGLALDGDDRPVASVGLRNECKSGTTIYRLRQDGGRLSSFGSEGVRAFKRLNLGVVEPSGAMVLSGQQGRVLDVVRIGANGGRDGSFGKRGSARIVLPVAVGIHLRPAAVDGRGRILLAGFVGSPDGSPAKGQPRHSSFVVARLLPDGKLDRSFGNRGWILTPLPRPLEITSAQATRNSQGRLLIAGTVGQAPQARRRVCLGPLPTRAIGDSTPRQGPNDRLYASFRGGPSIRNVDGHTGQGQWSIHRRIPPIEIPVPKRSIEASSGGRPQSS